MKHETFLLVFKQREKEGGRWGREAECRTRPEEANGGKEGGKTEIHIITCDEFSCWFGKIRNDLLPVLENKKAQRPV